MRMGTWATRLSDFQDRYIQVRKREALRLPFCSTGFEHACRVSAPKINQQSHSPPARVVCAGVAAFELEYDRWVDEQNRHTAELRNALQPQGQASELELRMLVETGLSNYKHLFQIKSAAAQSDAFYVMSGMWKTPVERFFLWIGGFRPSEVLKVPGLSLRHSAASDARYN
jgi:hypothetical protein